jgi:hypothetical protein
MLIVLIISGCGKTFFLARTKDNVPETNAVTEEQIVIKESPKELDVVEPVKKQEVVYAVSWKWKAGLALSVVVAVAASAIAVYCYKMRNHVVIHVPNDAAKVKDLLAEIGKLENSLQVLKIDKDKAEEQSSCYQSQLRVALTNLDNSKKECKKLSDLVLNGEVNWEHDRLELLNAQTRIRSLEAEINRMRSAN